MQHQMMPPRQTFQQPLHQAMTMMQIPAPYSNASSPSADPPQKAIQKGRFRGQKLLI